MSPSVLQKIQRQLEPYQCKLIAVSKTKSKEMIQQLFDQGQRHFGENRVQELVDKQAQLPAEIKWHFIGHLQSNKVKYIAPFVHLIHAVDSWKLLKEIDKRAKEHHRTIDVLLQFKIAAEETKYGYTADEVFKIMENEDWMSLQHIRICGVMGMATFTEDKAQIEREFSMLTTYFDRLKSAFFADVDYFKERSMGMSGDYLSALKQGSTMVRIGSLLFGKRM